MNAQISGFYKEAFCRFNRANADAYNTALAELHCRTPLHGAVFYAQKLFLGDLGDEILGILFHVHQLKPVFVHIFVLQTLQMLDCGCFRGGRLQKSSQNAIIFVINVAIALHLGGVVQFLLHFFEDLASRN